MNVIRITVVEEGKRRHYLTKGASIKGKEKRTEHRAFWDTGWRVCTEWMWILSMLPDNGVGLKPLPCRASDPKVGEDRKILRLTVSQAAQR